MEERREDEVTVVHRVGRGPISAMMKGSSRYALVKHEQEVVVVVE